ncbi:hypothetical protein MLD38_031391 [Melastoma candidum]|uniref:Uncharacterized protein n=1 Tax=Melastoma candidum TaxID=119954 RepID=A0ACB9MNX3_9MYRT|nr:hypothetical protein MLD38_031391 [Melastoma candidum]
MAKTSARLVIPIDLTKKPREQPLLLHNRWHPEIPPVVETKVGELFRVEMVNCCGGAITMEESADDVKYADASSVCT